MRTSVIVLALALSSLRVLPSAAEESDRFVFAEVAREIEGSVELRDATRFRSLSDTAFDENWDALAGSAAALGEDLARSRHHDPRAFAVVATYRAIAAAARGEAADAVWHWHVALNLWPDLDHGEARRVFDVTPALLDVGLPGYSGSSSLPEELESLPSSVDPPSHDRRTNVRLDFLVGPYASHQPPFQFSAQLWVGIDGRFHSPRVLGPSSGRPADTYSALEALRRWRFKPGMQNGQPVEFRWSVNWGPASAPPTGGRGKRW